MQSGEKNSVTAPHSSTMASTEPEMQSSDDDASDNSLAEGDSGEVHCSIDNDVINELPTTSWNSENDTSRLDFSQAVQLKKSRNLTDAEKYDF